MPVGEGVRKEEGKGTVQTAPQMENLGCVLCLEAFISLPGGNFR